MKRTLHMLFLLCLLGFCGSSPAKAEVLLSTDVIDPVTEPMRFDPETRMVNVDYYTDGFLLAEGFYAMGERWGLEGTLMIGPEGLDYASLGGRFLLGEAVAEAGLSVLGADIYLRTGITGMLPVFQDNQGVGIALDTIFSTTSATSSIEAGWTWLFGEHSYLLAGVYSAYTYVYSYSDLEGSSPVAFLAHLCLEENFHTWALQGNLKVLYDGDLAGAADLSAAYMVTETVGLGGLLRVVSDASGTSADYGLDVSLRF